MPTLAASAATTAGTNIELFTCASDYQPGVSIRLFQEVGRNTGKRQFLDQLDLEGLNAPCDQTQIEVTFDLDANGILRVLARDCESGQEKRMRVVPQPPAELLQARQKLQHCIRNLQSLLDDRRGHLALADLEPLRLLIKNSRTLVRRHDVGIVRKALGKLEEARDALLRYLDGSLRSNSADPSQQSAPKRTEFDRSLEI